MSNLRVYIEEHKKLVGILGLLFIVCLECCVFPVGNLMRGGSITIGLINLVTAVGIGKCIGEIETVMFPNAKWLSILFLNFGVTILGMVARYLLECGEVSNTYNFTLKNILVHIVIMMLLSMMFWMHTKKTTGIIHEFKEQGRKQREER